MLKLYQIFLSFNKLKENEFLFIFKKMKLSSKETLTEEDVQKGLKGIIRNGYFSQIMLTLTQGTFLIIFALKLGASNLIIGFLAAIPPLTQVIQIPSIYLIEKYRVRRIISVYCLLGYRSCIFLMALIPLLFNLEIGLIFLIMLISCFLLLVQLVGLLFLLG